MAPRLVEECDGEGHDYEGQHEYIGPKDRAQHGAYLLRGDRPLSGIGVVLYCAAHNRGFHYRMFAIAGRIDEFGDRIVLRGGEMAMEGDRSGSEGMPSDVAARLGMIEARLEKPLTEQERNEVRGRIARSITLGVA